MTCHSLQSVTSERRYGAVNMVRSQIEFDQIHFFLGLISQYFKSRLYKGNGVKLKDDRDPAQWQDLTIQMLTSPIYGAVSGLSYKQLSQIRYHFKA